MLNLYIPSTVTKLTRTIVVTFTFDRRYGNNSLITLCPINVKLNGMKYETAFPFDTGTPHVDVITDRI